MISIKAAINPLRSLALLALLALITTSFPLPAGAATTIATPTTATATSPETTATTTTTTTSAAQPYQVRVEGTGPPMLLIPGMMCDGTVWDATVAHYRDRYQCHIFSLAGFAGVPPVEGPFIPTMRDALVNYIRDNNLRNPIIIGHSLGGHLAYAIALEAPQEVGPVIAVDGVPAFGALVSSDASTATIATRAALTRGMMSMMSQEALAAQSKNFLASMVTDPKTAERLAKTAGKSHPKTVANAMYELTVSDLREDIAAIQSPVLLIGAAEFAKDDATRKAVRTRYEQQVEKIPNHKVVMTQDARHFVMLDKPEFFYDTVDQFLESLKKDAMTIKAASRSR